MVEDSGVVLSSTVGMVSGELEVVVALSGVDVEVAASGAVELVVLSSSTIDDVVVVSSLVGGTSLEEVVLVVD